MIAAGVLHRSRGLADPRGHADRVVMGLVRRGRRSRRSRTARPGVGLRTVQGVALGAPLPADQTRPAHGVRIQWAVPGGMVCCCGARRTDPGLGRGRAQPENRLSYSLPMHAIRGVGVTDVTDPVMAYLVGLFSFVLDR